MPGRPELADADHPRDKPRDKPIRALDEQYPEDLAHAIDVLRAES
jgi:hypothetical protein